MKVLSVALLLALPVLVTPALALEKKKVSFVTIDNLRVTADLYVAHEDPKTPFIVLFHQAGWSRGEYVEIAPRLNQLGYNCMAVDQRSGSTINGVANETVERAVREGRETKYDDALPDLVAALKFVREKHAKGKVIAWGSSYSAALVLKVAGDYPELVDGALAFAPGEYFAKLGHPEDWVRTSAKKITGPVFITSAKKEHAHWKDIFEAIPSEKKASYLPETDGNHGSRALWKKFEDSAGYWKAVEAFLGEHFPAPHVPAKVDAKEGKEGKEGDDDGDDGDVDDGDDG